MRAKYFHFIPKVGVNLANITNTEEGEMKVGLNVGWAGELKLTEKFAIESGFMYSMQGMKGEIEIEYEEYSTKRDVTANINYLNIPLLAKGYLAGGFHVFTGPQFGFLMNAKTKVKGWGIDASEDLSPEVNSFTMDLVMGLGYQFPVGLLLSANYNLGLLNVWEKSDLILEPKNRHSTFQINVGWRF
ncbi:MAG: PorT family protein [Tannerellaceae bacterium]|nr:PorT family protein [Tannerellaceae bacterium]